MALDTGALWDHLIRQTLSLAQGRRRKEELLLLNNESPLCSRVYFFQSGLLGPSQSCSLLSGVFLFSGEQSRNSFAFSEVLAALALSVVLNTSAIVHAFPRCSLPSSALPFTCSGALWPDIVSQKLAASLAKTRRGQTLSTTNQSVRFLH
ncbi:hypothetical protein MHYP_G00135920 [Metynnis hypsauchen]